MKILFEDSQILVCYKEAGLPVQSGRVGAKDLVSVLKNYLWEQNGRRGEPYLGVVHRLDQPVEGILVFAKTPKAAGELSAQASDGRMKKIYRAVVRLAPGDGPEEKLSTDAPGVKADSFGEEIPEEGMLEDYLLKDNRTNRSRIVPAGTKGAKLARLEYRILKKTDAGALGGQALVEIRLHTGRHHQIRVQMAGAGMPLCGDRKYGNISEEEIQNIGDHFVDKGRYSGDLSGDGALALCAVSLQFFYPGTGKIMEFHCEPRGQYFVRGDFGAVQ